ncbi:MAG: hypothetical protein KF883_15640 [Thermomicrobiales bacterium]|nr:hypothetical protein [Thermomicrobiales bacterium]
MPNLFLELRSSDENSGVSLPPLTEREALDMLAAADIEAASLIPWGSNYSFAVALASGDGHYLGIYKPRAGEAPLHDFRNGTLYKREVAAYVLSRWLGWDVVPPTIAREGPHGVGSLQLYVEPDESIDDPGAFWGARSIENERLVLFDHLTNNADRKLSHCLLDVSGKVWGIDHGLTFNDEPKLRTVMWQFTGTPISESLTSDLVRLSQEADAIAVELVPWLTRRELAAFQARVDALLTTGHYPQLDPYRNIPYGWW